jgi:aminoglycoside phosphotransferase (APT) family kinase protein
MALLNTLDVPAAEAALRGWLRGRMPGASDVEISNLDIPQSAGMSMTTVLFEAGWRQEGRTERRSLAARVAPSAPGIFKRPDLAKEFRILQALGSTDVGVPTVHWLEEDPSIIGSPFMVMERVEGRVPADDPPFTAEGWVLELEPAGRGKLIEGTLQAIKRVHAVDWEALNLRKVLDEPEFGPTGIEQQLGHWADVYEWAASDGVRSATIDDGFVWMKAHCPADGKLVLNWGDARPGNIVFGDDLSVRAVLDWEMATIGSPQIDVGWMAFIIRYFTEGIGVPLPAGMPDRERMIARYQQLTGNDTPHVDFYEAFSALKLSILYLRLASLMIAAGKLPRDSAIALNNPPSQILAKLTGLPAPGGEVENYVGNR